MPKKLSDTITLTWHIDDVKEVRPDLTKRQCREVLARCKTGHDANLGVNWDVVGIWAEELYPEKQG
jgi:hypothetical protein